MPPIDVSRAPHSVVAFRDRITAPLKAQIESSREEIAELNAKIQTNTMYKNLFEAELDENAKLRTRLTARSNAQAETQGPATSDPGHHSAPVPVSEPRPAPSSALPQTGSKSDMTALLARLKDSTEKHAHVSAELADAKEQKQAMAERLRAAEEHSTALAKRLRRSDKQLAQTSAQLEEATAALGTITAKHADGGRALLAATRDATEKQRALVTHAKEAAVLGYRAQAAERARTAAEEERARLAKQVAAVAGTAVELRAALRDVLVVHRKLRTDRDGLVWELGVRKEEAEKLQERLDLFDPGFRPLAWAIRGPLPEIVVTPSADEKSNPFEDDEEEDVCIINTGMLHPPLDMSTGVWCVVEEDPKVSPRQPRQSQQLSDLKDPFVDPHGGLNELNHTAPQQPAFVAEKQRALSKHPLSLSFNPIEEVDEEAEAEAEGYADVDAALSEAEESPASPPLSPSTSSLRSRSSTSSSSSTRSSESSSPVTPISTTAPLRFRPHRPTASPVIWAAASQGNLDEPASAAPVYVLPPHLTSKVSGFDAAAKEKRKMPWPLSPPLQTSVVRPRPLRGAPLQLQRPGSYF
ncbi:uncharacterized protein BXZ73DRAFT_102693 [Epithele typhae]|uniref:uncharacterized protein n=1 Tax=Epithele typhae TaxID=378194 RepID=UPI002007E3B6|nr:uncharacterized protein BXZ73DRAFT_102693 [Epithele typhae]KAH9927102.1 hypothetical protein BXZ73DRAFT_102693 [Epithele typhae]